MSARTRGRKERRCVFLTGYPSFLSQHVLELLLDDGHDVRLLVMTRHADTVEAAMEERAAAGLPGTCTVLEGDVTHLDLGLTGKEIQSLIEDVDVVHHTATAYHLAVPKRVLQRVNITGTRRVLTLAREMKSLKRLCHYSTALVAGTREGVIREDDLEMGQRFHNAFERTKFDAERWVRRAMAEMPTTIFRPSIVVGDSRTGEVDEGRGAHLLLTLFVNLPHGVPLPLPGQGHFPLNLVPADYVARCAYQLSMDSRAEGRTFHLTDPNPLSVRDVFNLVSDLAHRPRPLDAAVNLVPYRIARAALSLPGVQGRTRGVIQLLDALHSLAIYNRINTDELLAGGGPACPPFSAYAEKLVRTIRTERPAELQIDLDEDDF